MDIETMKMAAQIIQNLAASGKEAFIWWLMVEGVLPRVLWTSGVGISAYTIYRVAKLIYDRCALERSHDAARELAYSTMQELGSLLHIPVSQYISSETVTLIKHNIIAAIGNAAMQKAKDKE